MPSWMVRDTNVKIVDLRLRIREDLKLRLQEIAKQKNRSLNGQVTYFLRKAIKEYERG